MNLEQAFLDRLGFLQTWLENLLGSEGDDLPCLAC